MNAIRLGAYLVGLGIGGWLLAMIVLAVFRGS